MMESIVTLLSQFLGSDGMAEFAAIRLLHISTV